MKRMRKKRRTRRVRKSRGMMRIRKTLMISVKKIMTVKKRIHKNVSSLRVFKSKQIFVSKKRNSCEFFIL